MNVSLYQAAAGMTANSQWQDIISDNLASSSVPGFRKQSLATAAIQAGLVPVNRVNGTAPPTYFSIPQSSASVSFKNGELNYTGDNRNVAVDGRGWFQVQLPNGTPAVTRDGEFRISPHHELVTKEGYKVLGQGGPIRLDPSNSDPVAVSSQGVVSQGATVRGTLNLTDFENPNLLTETNGVYFLADNPKLKTITATGTLREGYIEGSNSNSLGEMASMMTAMRGFEANQKVIQLQDDRMNKVITELGATT